MGVVAASRCQLRARALRTFLCVAVTRSVATASQGSGVFSPALWGSPTGTQKTGFHQTGVVLRALRVIREANFYVIMGRAFGSDHMLCIIQYAPHGKGSIWGVIEQLNSTYLFWSSWG